MPPISGALRYTAFEWEGSLPVMSNKGLVELDTGFVQTFDPCLVAKWILLPGSCSSRALRPLTLSPVPGVSSQISGTRRYSHCIERRAIAQWW